MGRCSEHAYNLDARRQVNEPEQVIMFESKLVPRFPKVYCTIDMGVRFKVRTIDLCRCAVTNNRRTLHVVLASDFQGIPLPAVLV